MRRGAFYRGRTGVLRCKRPRGYGIFLAVPFDIAAVAAHLSEHYGIEGTVSEVSRGRATNFCVSTHSRRWLWKVFQPELTVARVSKAADFVAFMSRAGYPAREYARACDGREVLPFGDRVAVLIPWIDGATPEPNHVVSIDAVTQIGQLCGELHQVASAYPSTDRRLPAGSGRSLNEKQIALAQLLAQQPPGSEVGGELATRLDLLSQSGSALEASQRRAQFGMIHGDFQGAHVVFDGPRAVGVIDVLGEWYLLGWELMRGFFQSVPIGLARSDHEALLRLWQGYLEGYRTANPTCGGTDIETAYDVYLLQLITSTYGLRPPLDPALRAFGRWRTEVARYLHDHRNHLRTQMAAL
jgi:hypothetical protein